MAIANDLTLNSKTYTRVPGSSFNEGRFMNTDTSINTPELLVIKPRVVRDGVCTFQVSASQAKDSTSMVAGAKDDVLSVMVSIRFDPRRFTNAEVMAQKEIVDALLSANLAAVLRGDI